MSPQTSICHSSPEALAEQVLGQLLHLLGALLDLLQDATCSGFPHNLRLSPLCMACRSCMCPGI